MKNSGQHGKKKASGKLVKPAGLRMKELTSATGLPKSAILHYVSQGLLPEPVKTSPNMAYYDPVCIERIEFIKTMQEKYAFPLSKIKMILSAREEGADVTPLVELSATIFGEAESSILSEVEFCDATGLKLAEVRKFIKYGLILPLEKGKYNQQDVEVCGNYAKCLALGLKVEDFIFYAEAARIIVDREMRLRCKLTAHLPEEQDADLSRLLVMGARAVRGYVIERTFQHRVAKATDLKDAALLGEEESTGREY
ncbi:MAG: MerR family transcriptional regulator [Geobacteraceae bacterium]